MSTEDEIDRWWTDTFLRLLNERRFEELVMEHFTDEALVMPPNSASISGRQAILAWFEQLFAPLHGLQLSIERDSMECLVTGEYAVHIEEGKFVGTSSDGVQRLIEMPRKYLHVFRRDSGAWKLHRYIWNEGAAGT